MKQICVKCSTATLCPECNKEMPIIISTCRKCNIELFRSMTYETKEYHTSYCFSCISVIESGYTLYEAHRNKDK